jgi:Fe-S cluster assembly protein SufD
MTSARSTAEPAARVLERKAAAAAAWQAAPRPGPKEESWRRCDPAQFDPGRWTPSAAARPASGLPSAPAEELFDLIVRVRGGGAEIVDPGRFVERGRVTVRLLEDADGAEGAGAHLADWGARGLEPYELYADGHYTAGLWIHIHRTVQLDAGILVDFSADPGGALLVPRLAIRAGERSAGAVVVQSRSPEGAAGGSIGLTTASIEPDASLTLVELPQWGGGHTAFQSTRSTLAGDARLNWFGAHLGAGVSRHDVRSALEAPGGSAELNGLYAARREQFIEQATLQDHRAPDTTSRVLYKGLARGRGRSVYRGMIRVAHGAQRTDAYQTNNNLVLDDGARADSIPGLEIQANDLSCSHGSTVGHLDPEQVFYLQTRGLSRGDAERMMVRGFYEGVIERLPDGFLRDLVRERLESVLGS